MATNTASNTRETEREATGSTSRTAERDTTGSTSRTARAMSEAAERTTRTTAEAFRRNAEGFSNTWRESSEAASRITERSMDQLSKMMGLGGESARQTMQQSASGVQALVDSSTVLAGAFQTLSGEWMRFVQQRTEGNLEHVDDLISCRTPHDCVALQMRIVRDNMEALLQTARRTSELSTKFADDAVKRLNEATTSV
jgi:phasin family protein